MFGITFRKETEEERWLRKALDGDNTATEWIYRKHVRYLSALCSRYITEDEDIKDVLQESFIKIFTSLDSFKYRGEGSLKAWIAKITLNETLKFLRNNSRLPIDSIDDKDTNIADDDSMEAEDIPTDVQMCIRDRLYPWSTLPTKPKILTLSLLHSHRGRG